MPRCRLFGVLFAGNNPAIVDAVACRLMGFDPQLFPIVIRAPLHSTVGRSCAEGWEDIMVEQPDGLAAYHWPSCPQ